MEPLGVHDLCGGAAPNAYPPPPQRELTYTLWMAEDAWDALVPLRPSLLSSNMGSAGMVTTALGELQSRSVDAIAALVSAVHSGAPDSDASGAGGLPPTRPPLAPLLRAAVAAHQDAAAAGMCADVLRHPVVRDMLRQRGALVPAAARSGGADAPASSDDDRFEVDAAALDVVLHTAASSTVAFARLFVGDGPFGFPLLYVAVRDTAQPELQGGEPSPLLLVDQAPDSVTAAAATAAAAAAPSMDALRLWSMALSHAHDALRAYLREASAAASLRTLLDGDEGGACGVLPLHTADEDWVTQALSCAQDPLHCSNTWFPGGLAYDPTTLYALTPEDEPLPPWTLVPSVLKSSARLQVGGGVGAWTPCDARMGVLALNLSHASLRAPVSVNTGGTADDVHARLVRLLLEYAVQAAAFMHGVPDAALPHVCVAVGARVSAAPRWVATVRDAARADTALLAAVLPQRPLSLELMASTKMAPLVACDGGQVPLTLRTWELLQHMLVSAVRPCAAAPHAPCVLPTPSHAAAAAAAQFRDGVRAALPHPISLEDTFDDQWLRAAAAGGGGGRAPYARRHEALVQLSALGGATSDTAVALPPSLRPPAPCAVPPACLDALRAYLRTLPSKLLLQLMDACSTVKGLVSGKKHRRVDIVTRLSDGAAAGGALLQRASSWGGGRRGEAYSDVDRLKHNTMTNLALRLGLSAHALRAVYVLERSYARFFSRYAYLARGPCGVGGGSATGKRRATAAECHTPRKRHDHSGRSSAAPSKAARSTLLQLDDVGGGGGAVGDPALQQLQQQLQQQAAYAAFLHATMDAADIPSWVSTAGSAAERATLEPSPSWMLPPTGGNGSDGSGSAPMFGLPPLVFPDADNVQTALGIE